MISNLYYETVNFLNICNKKGLTGMSLAFKVTWLNDQI